MANAVVTAKIMPESPEVDMEGLQAAVIGKIKGFAGEGDTRTAIEPVAFGLQALKVTFVMDENLGSPDALEAPITGLDGVSSFEVVDVRRAIG
ncbi:elongation factor 1-beta [Candidatus Woesearchaeota archaeon]|nr:elongation factor 1-beta [Candidatus Woesearchaeota archaeon]